MTAHYTQIPHITVIVPAFNEAAAISNTVVNIAHHLDQLTQTGMWLLLMMAVATKQPTWCEH